MHACTAPAGCPAAGSPSGSATSLVTYVHGEVTDQGSAWDGDLAARACAPHGLYLLRELSASYGTAGGRCARTVWFTVSYPATVTVAGERIAA
jgi:hypothetical protein